MKTTLPSSTSVSRKRNPYSIEELLKKPEKKRKSASSFVVEEEKKICEANEETLNVESCD